MQIQGPRLLVVDDEPLNQEIIAEYLGDSAYTLKMADDGAIAWSILQSQPDSFDAVLLDRMMPNMDGIEVIERMKQHPSLRGVPVIMQTAAAAKDDVVSGLQAGAYYYLTKPFEEGVLRSIVDAAVEDYRRHRTLVEQLQTRDGVLHMIESVELSIRTLDDARNTATFIADACPQPERVVMGFSELLVNGVEHGNLQVSYADKSRLNSAGEWENEIQRRLADPAHAHKRVKVQYQRVSDKVTVRITDEGDGFDWERYLEMDPARAFDSHGRGIAMARMLSFDKVTYLGSGNQVEVEINLTPLS
ncbi:MAG: response regulator [Gammaproteobacteria bacterium]|nr:response regulator [Gammaproteobacteria bacterium]